MPSDKERTARLRQDGRKGDNPMTINRYLRMIAGFFIMLSVLLAHLHTPYWLFFTAFVGLNLFQSAFSNWCPMITLLRRLGVDED